MEQNKVLGHRRQNNPAAQEEGKGTSLVVKESHGAEQNASRTISSVSVEKESRAELKNPGRIKQKIVTACM